MTPFHDSPSRLSSDLVSFYTWAVLKSSLSLPSHDTISARGPKGSLCITGHLSARGFFFRNWATLLLGSVGTCSLVSLARSGVTFLSFVHECALPRSEIGYHSNHMAISYFCVFFFVRACLHTCWYYRLVASSCRGSHILSVGYLSLPVTSSQSHSTFSESHANSIPTATFHTNSSHLLLHSSPIAPVASRTAVARTSTASALPSTAAL